MPLFALALATSLLAPVSAPAPERLTKAAALRQVAVHACLTTLAADATLAALDACVDGFAREVVVDDDGACARYGVLSEPLVLCQAAVADWMRAEAAQDLRGALLAAIRVQGRCAAGELCPRQAVRAAGFRRPSRSPPRTR